MSSTRRQRNIFSLLFLKLFTCRHVALKIRTTSATSLIKMENYSILTGSGETAPPVFDESWLKSGVLCLQTQKVYCRQLIFKFLKFYALQPVNARKILKKC